MKNLLPEFCFCNPTSEDGEAYILINGCEGYYPVESTNGKTARELNEMIGVTEIEERCMIIGSMFGFNVPEADPTKQDGYVPKVDNDDEPKEYEVLLDTVLNNNFGYYSRCESYWIDKSELQIKNIIDCFNEINPALREEFPWFFWGSDKLDKTLNSGKVVGLPYMKLRKKTDDPKCPRCGVSFKDYETALSRRDGKTLICSDCGMTEALEDYGDYR